MKCSLSVERTRQVLEYDPESGRFRWRVSDQWRRAGDRAGAEPSKRDGYVRIGVDGQIYLAHRIAFVLMTGRWPAEQIDHVNMDRSDNRWVNLREATNKQNMENRGRQSNNTSGIVGVSWSATRGKWVAGIKHHGRRKNLGYFTKIEDAAATRAAAVARLFTHAPTGQR